jgi:hypothetical protein
MKYGAKEAGLETVGERVQATTARRRLEAGKLLLEQRVFADRQGRRNGRGLLALGAMRSMTWTIEEWSLKCRASGTWLAWEEIGIQSEVEGLLVTIAPS